MNEAALSQAPKAPQRRLAPVPLGRPDTIFNGFAPAGQTGNITVRPGVQSANPFAFPI